jgi:hypothetical protein
MQQGFIIQNQVARFLIGKQLHQALGGADLATEDGQDEVYVLSRKLGPAVRSNHHHRLYYNNSLARYLFAPATARRPALPCFQPA